MTIEKNYAFRIDASNILEIYARAVADQINVKFAPSFTHYHKSAEINADYPDPSVSYHWLTYTINEQTGYDLLYFRSTDPRPQGYVELKFEALEQALFTPIRTELN